MAAAHSPKESWKREDIPHIALPLPKFQYQHTPEAGQFDPDIGMVGRNNLIADLVSLLNNTRASHGSYLLAGFRGAGKTTLINTALDVYSGVQGQPSWLPGDSADPEVPHDQLRKILDRGRETLDAARHRDEAARARAPDAPPMRQRKDCPLNPWSMLKTTGCGLAHWFRRVRLRTCDQHARRWLNPLVHVHVNLATEGTLDARSVLYNTAYLLHQRLHDTGHTKKNWLRVAVLFATISGILWVIAACSPAELRVWLNDAVSGCISALGALPRSLATLIFGTERTNAAILVLHEGVLSDLGRVLQLVMLVVGVRLLWGRVLPTRLRIERRLADLLKRGRRTEETDQGLDAGAGLRYARRYTTPPLDAQRIEAELLRVLRDCRRIWRVFGRPDIVFVFDELDKISGARTHAPDAANPQPSDPADPLGDPATGPGHEVYRRKERVDELLATIKNFITEGQARFFFIAGREMLDSYQAERGNASSLYESLFNGVFEVPSLLTDAPPKLRENFTRPTETFVCRRLLDPDVATYLWYAYNFKSDGRDPCTPPNKEVTRLNLQYKPYCLRTLYHWLRARGIDEREARRYIFMLRHFIHFLTLHSWGNAKRLNSLFEHFIKPEATADPDTLNCRARLWATWAANAPDNAMVLQFGRMDQQRIMLASGLLVLVKHHLARQFSTGTDKLTVSLFAALQHLLKFHRLPFNRSHLERMDEALSVHRSPELNSAVDTLINLVLRSHVRLIRNGLSRYRFMQGYEQEIRYICRISDIESAAFNFSLDSTATVKVHYQALLRQAQTMAGDGQGPAVLDAARLADLQITLGDLLMQEDSLDQAAVYFKAAADLLLPIASEWQANADDVATALLPCVEALLKFGDVNERRQRYERAAAAYTLAQSVAAQWLARNDRKPPRDAGEVLRGAWRGDSKWDILKQPLWALRYLHLKRSPFPWAKDPQPPLAARYRENDPVYHYRTGQLAFYYGRFGIAANGFALAYKYAEHNPVGSDNERVAYLAGYALLDLAETALVAFMRREHLQIRAAVRGQGHGVDPKFDKSRVEINCGYIIRLSHAISSMSPTAGTPLGERELREYSAQRDQDVSPSDPGTVDPERVQQLRECCEQYAAAIDQLTAPENTGKIGPPKMTFGRFGVDLQLVFSIMLQVARRFERHGLSLHATVAYLKLISLWTSLLEGIPFSLLDPIMKGTSYLEREARHAFKDARSAIILSNDWLAPVRAAALRSVQAIDGNAFTETWYRIWDRDIAGWEQPGSGPPSEELQWGIGRLRECGPFAPKPCERGAEILKKLVKADSVAGTLEPFTMYHSNLWQKLLFVNAWHETVRLRVEQSQNSGWPGISFPEIAGMVPSSIRSLLFAHWIRGRALAWDAIRRGSMAVLRASKPASKEREDWSKAQDKWSEEQDAWAEAEATWDHQEKKYTTIKPQLTAGNGTWWEKRRASKKLKKLEAAHDEARQAYDGFLRKYKNAESDFSRATYAWQASDESLYEIAACAVHNLYRAHYYIRQMCGNDQDVMFPWPASVFYGLWRLIHTLLEREQRRAAVCALDEVLQGSPPAGQMEDAVACILRVGKEVFQKTVENIQRKGGGSLPIGVLVYESVAALKDHKHSTSQWRTQAYADAVCTVRGRLWQYSDPATPGQYCDYRFVTERTLTYLREVEQLGDLSSRARAAVLRGKYFLSDDFEDPRFHLDWSMIQMLAPSSALVREHVIAERRKLSDSEDDG